MVYLFIYFKDKSKKKILNYKLKDYITTELKFYGPKRYVTLDHKTSLKSLGYICSNSQKYIVWVKMMHFSFMPKIIRILSKDHVP